MASGRAEEAGALERGCFVDLSKAACGDDLCGDAALLRTCKDTIKVRW